MRKRGLFSVLAVLMVLAFSMSIVGCSDRVGEQPSQEDAQVDGAEEEVLSDDSDEDALLTEEDPVTEPVDNAADAEGDAMDVTGDSADDSTADEDGSAEELTEEQLRMNSLATLNYLTVLSRDVSASKGTRLELEALYHDLFNNTRPDRIDRTTLDQLIDISDTIHDYRMLDIKRERIEYMYEQNKAKALREAIPNPVALLSAVHSRSLPDLLLSIGYMAVDSYTGYKDALNNASMQCLTDGWELDDQQDKTLHKQRKNAFEYMFEMVNDYNLPGELALTEETVDELIKWKNNQNLYGRIQFLESNEDTYKGYGGYWLILAESYYMQSNFQGCLNAIATYEEVRPRMLRRDHDYAAALPLAIASAAETMDDEHYVEYASKHADEILKNSESDNWELRYLAAQTYVDIYSISSDEAYLKKAYDVALDNVNILVSEQRKQNEAYLSPLIAVKAENDSQKDEVKAYNKQRKKERETELPPVYQPLLVNCDLLFALADKLDVSDFERTKIDGILHPNGDPIFLTDPIDTHYRMTDGDGDAASGSIQIDDNGTKIILSASLISDASVVNIAVGKGSKAKNIPGEWTIKKVKRGGSGSAASFEVTIENKEAKGQYHEGDEVTVTISDGDGEGAVIRTYKFTAHVQERMVLPDTMTFDKA